MAAQPDKPLINELRSAAVRSGSRPGQILAKLHAGRVAYRYWHGGDDRRELTGCGLFMVDISGAELRCRVLGDLFKPSPFEFGFHQFWLTRRGMLMAVFDLAENRPPGSRSASETFIHFTSVHDVAIRRMAAAFRKSPESRKERKHP